MCDIYIRKSVHTSVTALGPYKSRGIGSLLPAEDLGMALGSPGLSNSLSPGPQLSLNTFSLLSTAGNQGVAHIAHLPM